MLLILYSMFLGINSMPYHRCLRNEWYKRMYNFLCLANMINIIIVTASELFAIILLLLLKKVGNARLGESD